MRTSLHVYFSFVTIIQDPVDGDEAHSPIGDVPLNVSSSNIGDDAADASKVCYLCLHFLYAALFAFSCSFKSYPMHLLWFYLVVSFAHFL
jgi:hypothetical protein